MLKKEATSPFLFILNALVMERIEFRLPFLLDLLTPSDRETDCSCKIRGEGEYRLKDKGGGREKRGKTKDVDNRGRTNKKSTVM